MKKKSLVVVVIALVMLLSVSLVACKDGGTEGGRVPVYQGMVISNASLALNSSPRMAPNDNASDVAKYIHGDHTGRDDDIDQDTPFDDAPTIEEKAESTLEVLGAGADIYYADKNQDIFITIKVSNPDSDEILSFTLNGVKYIHICLRLAQIWRTLL